MDCRSPGSSVHGISQARILEWVAISFSRASSQPRNRTRVSHTAGRLFTMWATREARDVLCSGTGSLLRDTTLTNAFFIPLGPRPPLHMGTHTHWSLFSLPLPVNASLTHSGLNSPHGICPLGRHPAGLRPAVTGCLPLLCPNWWL